MGGKTGINTQAGKNLVGAFHDPKAVVVDLDFLKTLPAKEYASGLAEVIKCGFIQDREILVLFQQYPQLSDQEWALTEGRAVLRDVVERAIKVKAEVVGSDRLEAGRREFLNYGHTLAHAIEKEEDYKMRHGDAVAIGAVFAAELAHSLGLLSPSDVAQHEELFSSAGLPTTYRGSLAALVEHMRGDKKVRSGQLRFVVLDGIGNPRVKVVTEDRLTQAAKKIGLD